MANSAVIFIDGASSGNPGPASVGVVLKKGKTKKEFSKYIGHTTNNVAEYTALIYGLQEALFDGIKHVTVKSDSQLLVNQINGSYKVKDKNLRVFYDINKHLISAFESFTIVHIARSENKLADKLASCAIP